MKKVQLIGVGAGGHAKVVIEILQLRKNFHLIGLLDSKTELLNTKVLGIPVLGDDNLLPKLYAQGIRHAFIGLGSAGDVRPRIRLYEKVRQHGFQIVDAIHPQSIISSSAKIGYGATISAGAVINAHAKLGENVMVNTGAIIEHDCVIDNHVHIATGARLASSVHVAEGTHIGIGACVRQCIHIGQGTIVGAGSVVVDDMPDKVIAAGVPARILRKMEK